MAQNMAADDTQGELHTASRTRRRKLEDFDCINSLSALSDMCCFGDDCYMDDCAVLPIYREYLALAKCARLLRVFMWWQKRWASW